MHHSIVAIAMLFLGLLLIASILYIQRLTVEIGIIKSSRDVKIKDITDRMYNAINSRDAANKISDDAKGVQIKKLQEMMEKESHLKASAQKRVVELENAIKKGTGVTLRNEITKVEAQFNKNEIIMMVEGIKELIPKNYKNMSDVKYFISLIEKAEAFVKKMDEIESEGFKQ